MKKLFPLFFVLSPAFASTNPDLPDSSTLTKKYLEELSLRKRGQTAFVVKNQMWSPRHQEEQSRTQQSESDQAGQGRDIQESDVYKLGNPAKKELFLLNNYRGFQVVSFEDGVERPKLISRLPIYNNWGSEMYYFEKQERVLVLNTEYESSYKTKIYMLDVSDSHEPKIMNEVLVDGYLQESRMVGDVLYTITHNYSSEKKMKITSVKIGDELETIEEADIQGEKNWVQTMNVVKDGKRYYVISTLTNWSTGGDEINVHDITSPNGKIKKLFTAKARGRITERSQTFIHKDHLFAVSNYQENNSPMRVSVEAFPLEKSSSTVTALPHMRVSVGDTNGLNASLQDVRVSGDHLYAFWVPANNVDPFELFDISKPQEGIKHLGQLQFDGWISKAFPMSHQGKNYVLGLGWIMPVTGESNKRYPQAKLFEVKNINGQMKHEVVSSLTLDNEDLWASLNVEDKFFEVMNDGEGKFNILFPVTFSKNWKDGAKVVSLDLNHQKLSEGTSIQGQQGWLKRVFANKELQSLHAFSDEELESFDGSHLGERGFSKTVSVLELARNILSFHVLDETTGVQLVSKNNALEIRYVSLANVDAEKTDVQKILSVSGTHLWHKVIDHKVYSITAEYADQKIKEARLNIADLRGKTIVTRKIDLPKSAEGHYYLNIRNISSDNTELFTISDQLYRLENDQLVQLEVDKSCKYFFDNSTGNLSLKGFGKDILAFNSFKLKEESESRYAYSMPFFKVLGFEGQQVSCSRSVNVPGMPVLAVDDFIVTSEDVDDWYDYHHYGQDVMKSEDYPGRRWRSASKTSALKLEEKEARLTDFLKRNIAQNVFDKGFVTVENNELNLWGLDDEGEFINKPYDLGDENMNLLSVKTFGKRSIVFLQNKKNLSVFDISGGKKVRELELASQLMTPQFSVNDITASPDLKSFYLSQGMYGVSELSLK